MALQPPTSRGPGGSPSSAGGGDGWLGTATKVAALLAGAVAVVYMLGGVVIALRLLFDGFSPSAVASVLGEVSREFVVSTAMIEVVAPVAMVGLLAGLAYAIFGPPRPWEDHIRRERAMDDGRLSWVELAAIGTVSFAAALPVLLGGAETEGSAGVAMVATATAMLAVTFGLVTVGWRYIRTLASARRSLVRRAAAVGVAWAWMAAAPAVLLAVALFEFEEVQICTTDGAAQGEGALLGSAPDRFLVALDFRGEESIRIFPASQVTRIEYGDLSSEFLCQLESPQATADAAAATAALGGHGSEVEQKLASELRPWLQFDSAERWRPLSVEAFVAEEFDDGRHGICRRDERPPCARELSDPEQLDRGVAYVDVHGGGRNGKGVRAPEADCAKPPPSVDCDDGEGSAVYYRRTSRGNRWYWDYWWFFRYSDYTGRANECRFVCGDHEGDWEGMTVITTASAEPEVLGAIYASHSARIEVGAAILPLVGKRPRAFVAEGTHATYPFACSRSCRQYSTLGLLKLQAGIFEESHDGAAGWSHNSDESCEEVECVRPMPEGGGREEGGSLPIAGKWAAWNGRWGETCHDGCPGAFRHYESSPRSPGNQTRFRCPWVPTVRAMPQVGSRGPLTTRPVGDKERLLAACRARRGGL